MHLFTTSLVTSCQFQPDVKPTVANSNTTNDEHCDFCPPEPRSPEEALVEREILDAIVWPETPLLREPFSLEGTSDPAHSTFDILPGRAGGEWRVGDQLEVMIQMYDFRGSPKKSGGDVLLAQMHNRELDAGVAGQVVDHLNGSYTAVFSLLWEGEAQVEVMLKTDVLTPINKCNLNNTTIATMGFRVAPIHVHKTF